MGITQSLHRWAQQAPDREAVVEGESRTTFLELRERVARLGGALRGLGVEPGDRVAILALNSTRYLECLNAVPWAGGVLNPVNIRWTPVEIAYTLGDSRTEVLFVDDAFTGAVPVLRSRLAFTLTVVHIGDGPTPEGMYRYEDLLAGAEPTPDADRGGSDLAGVFYTGGTTGFPKGVMLSHDNLLASAMGGLVATAAFRIVPNARVLHAAPLFHIAGYGVSLMTSIVGIPQVILPFFDAERVAALVQEQRVTEIFLAPTMLQMVLDHPRFATYDLSSLRLLTYGASPITATLLDRVLKALPGTSLVQAYGQTELSPLATLLMPQDHLDADPARLRSAGRPCFHADVRVVGPDEGELGRGEVGEIVSRGDHVMLGYWNRPDESEQVLRGGWMHTGDLGFMDTDGYLTVVDRLKDMIVTGGENVFSAEVENAVGTHPDVEACAVIGLPDATWGERVHAVVVLHAGRDVGADEIRAHAKTLIAGYKAPRSVEFVEKLPLTAAGKVRKSVLRERKGER
ncbi:long-chain-fatty-acid--CoA ligase [Streptomyces sp. SID3343]|uniref:long-chain-fatty-acid--CoA ligase n=1 Tax=Streptomyces sp. SID3343 TaxID=2690260 RepID=UPI00136BE96B|nr:long-chain-fatty-acid--CoA ligase [Streptomyces sp. SID3343]MYW04030.1 long-chain-fatty-acid--CoA ligase [Streptomyces sp. SID3343]